MEDSTIALIAIGAIINLAAVICFFVLCNNVSKLTQRQDEISTLLKSINRKLPEIEKKEDNEFEFLK